MESLTIRELIQRVEQGGIRIPAFQRGFVWDPDRVAHLIDSIYKQYPFGSLLFWRANELLRVEKELGPFELLAHKEDFPIDYVLDGQQRVTSIFSTFQTEIEMKDDSDWKEIYFDYQAKEDSQEPQFFALGPHEVDRDRHFPLRCVFDTVEYRRNTAQFDEDTAAYIDNMQSRFKESRLPVQVFRTEDKGTVAIIFERINRQGVPLNTLQLLSAWTWSEDFQLQGQFDELIDELEGIGFDASDFAENLLLRCASAILTSNPRPDAIVQISGEIVRNRFDEVMNGVLGALDFLRLNLGICRLENIPYQAQLIPLSVFFAVSGTREIVVAADQRREIMKWFWRSSFGRRFSSQTIRALDDDIIHMLQLKGGQSSALADISASIDADFFLENDFSVRNVNTKTFVLMLASKRPLSWISGQPVNLEEKLKAYNKAEFHHMMPKAFARDRTGGISVNCLANHCFLSRSENKRLGAKPPSEYRLQMATPVEPILESAFTTTTLFGDQFKPFVNERAKMLLEHAKSLMET